MQTTSTNSAQENIKDDLSCLDNVNGSMNREEENDDIDDLLNDNKKMDLATMWTAFNKCKSFIKHGQRLENMSWRLWKYNHQQLLLEAEQAEENQLLTSHTHTISSITTSTINTTDTTVDTSLDTAIKKITPPPSSSCTSLTKESPVKANSLHEVPQPPPQQKQQKDHDENKLFVHNKSCNNEVENNRTPNISTPILSQHQQQQQHAQHTMLRNATLVKHGKKYIYIVDDDEDEDEDDDYYPSDDEDDYYDYYSDDTDSCSRNDQNDAIAFKKTIPQQPTAAQRRSLLSDLFNRPPSLLLSNSTSSFGTTSTSTTTADNTSLSDSHTTLLEQQSKGLIAGTPTTGSSAINASASLYHPVSRDKATDRKSSFSFAPFFNKTNNDPFNWKESFRGW